MNNPPEFADIIEDIIKENLHYRKSAYFFVRDALEYTIKGLNLKDKKKEAQHVNTDYLLEGIKEFALSQYGPMASTVLDYWGIRTTKDFGCIVFILVDNGIFGKNEDDSQEDFFNKFDFENVFAKPFLPQKKPKNK